MARCRYCKQEMTDPKTTTCTANDGVRFRGEKDLPSVPYSEYEDKDHRCHDCQILPGQKHHPGCDMERCPRCRGQLISCNCPITHVVTHLPAKARSGKG